MVSKKLVLALPFLFCLAAFYQQAGFALENIYLGFDLEGKAFILLTFLIIWLILTGISFVTFTTLASDWRLILPVCFLGSVTTFLFMPFQYALILSVTSLLAFAICNFALQKALTSYLTFQTKQLLVPATHQIIFLLIFFTSIVFYFSANSIIKSQGFQLPANLTRLVSGAISQQTSSSLNSSLPALSADQKDELQQLGINQGTIGNVAKRAEGQTNTSALVQKQVQNFIDPYKAFIPPVLALLFFVTLYSLTSLLGFLLNPLLSLIFFILDKTGFTKYKTEMREVKKLIV